MQNVLDLSVNDVKPTSDELVDYLRRWDDDYQKKVKEIPLFQPELTKRWTLDQKQYFIKVFYHLRGHFADFLWYMGNFAPNYEIKQMIINNIRDEFGMRGVSHEKLYHIFAKNFGVDLTYELIDETAYLPFAKKYIDGQLRWLREHSWDHCITAFAAIERLDNVDYVNLKNVAISIGTEKEALTFFNVHINANHFEAVLDTALNEMWNKNKKFVKEIFSFIREYQIEMFSELSNKVFNYVKT